MQILGLLGMYFNAVVVKVEKYLLFFRLSLAILCILSIFSLGNTQDFCPSLKKRSNQKKGHFI